MSQCATCQAEIIWGVTASGQRMPIDAAPVAGGNLAIRPPGAQVRYLRKSDDSLEADEWRGVSHFATCPDARTHRKSR